MRLSLALTAFVLTTKVFSATPAPLFTTNADLADGKDTVEIELAAPYAEGSTRLEVWTVTPPGRLAATLAIEGTSAAGDRFRRQRTRFDSNLRGVQQLEVRPASNTSADSAIRVRSLTVSTRSRHDPFLKTDGIYLKNDRGCGDIVRLHGVNLGGWLLQESFMSPLRGGWDEYRARATLKTRFGEARAERLISAFQDAWLTDEDFARMADAGLNCVRLPIYWQNHMNEDGLFKRLGDGLIDFSRLDWVIQSAKRHGIYTLLDLHGAPGSQNGRDHAGDQRGPLLWDSDHYQALTKSLWRELARRYRDEPAVAGYDLLNEPARTNKAKQWDQTIIDFMSELYAEVREIDPDHTVFFSVWSEYDHVGNLPAGKNNYVLAYHWYVYRRFLETEGSESDFWIQRVLRNGALSRDRHDAPCFIGEFSFKDDPALWPDRLAFITRQGLGWAKWAYKTRAGAGWGLYEANGANDGNIPDLEHDDEATIRQKWASWRTAKTFVPNPSVHASMIGSAKVHDDKPIDFPRSQTVTPLRRPANPRRHRRPSGRRRTRSG